MVGLKEQLEAKSSIFDNEGVELYAAGFGVLLWFGVGGGWLWCFVFSLPCFEPLT